jgi:glycosyltransferase involved in cell wall biosynthesis
MKLAWVLYGLPGGGVGTVCHNAVEAVARCTPHEVSLVASHKCEPGYSAPPGVRLYDLELPDALEGAALGFHQWLGDNPQDVIFLNDDAMLEPYLPHVTRETAVGVVIHDDGRRYLRGVSRHHRHIDAVVAVSDYVASAIGASLAAFEGGLTTIQNGASFPPARPRAEHASPLKLLFVGRLEGVRKGAGDIPGILSVLGDSGFGGSLSVIGGRDAGMEAACSRAAPGIKVNWLGRLSRAECLRHGAEHDVLLMLSRREPFGMVTVEAMGMGCVPVAYDGPGGSQEIIEAGVSGLLVPAGRRPAVAEAVGRLDADRALLAGMANAAMERARLQFSAERMGRDYVVLAEELCTALPSERCRLPFEDFVAKPTRRRLYQRLPQGLRSRVRRLAGRSPRLSRLLRRWYSA